MSGDEQQNQADPSGQQDPPAPVVLSYATPLERLSRKISGISNPRSLIAAYFTGVALAIIGLFAAESFNDPVVGRRVRLGDYSPLANDLLITLMIAGVVTTLFAFALTRPVFPASRPPRKCPPWIAILVGVGHPLLLFTLAEASFHFNWNDFGIALIFLFLAVPILSGIWIRHGPTR